jgi:hypothetical protein
MPLRNATCQVSSGKTSSNIDGSTRMSYCALRTYAVQLAMSTTHHMRRRSSHTIAGTRRVSTTNRPMMLNTHGPMRSSSRSRIAYQGGG